MSKQRLIERITQHREEKQLNKPIYKIKNLYVGKIVLLKERQFEGFGIWTTHSNFVKRFAIFTQDNYNTYTHIQSGQKLKDIDSAEAIIGDYAVHIVAPFEEVFATVMRQCHHTKDTKFSKNEIIEIETETNETLYPNQNQNSLFGL